MALFNLGVFMHLMLDQILAVSVVRAMVDIAIVAIAAIGLIALILWIPFGSAQVKKVACWVIGAIAVLGIVFYLLKITGVLDGGGDNIQVPNVRHV